MKHIEVTDSQYAAYMRFVTLTLTRREKTEEMSQPLLDLFTYWYDRYEPREPGQITNQTDMEDAFADGYRLGKGILKAKGFNGVL